MIQTCVPLVRKAEEMVPYGENGYEGPGTGDCDLPFCLLVNFFQQRRYLKHFAVTGKVFK
jgi:hypothetical protein